MQIQITKEEYKEQAELLYERVAASEYCKGVKDGQAIAIKRLVEIINKEIADVESDPDEDDRDINDTLQYLKAQIVSKAIA